MKMPRFRIAWLMALVGIVALELGVTRTIMDFTSPDRNLTWLVTMLGLACQAMVNILGVGLLVGYRWPGSRSFIAGFEAFGATALALYIAGVTVFTKELIPVFERAVRPLADFLRDGPIISRVNLFVACTIIAVVLSLPQLAFAAVGGFLTQRRCVGGIMAVFLGPLVGACLAWICIALRMLHSGDVGVLAVIGAGMGLLTGVAWGTLAVPGGRWRA
jgi:hypothetical protein